MLICIENIFVFMCGLYCLNSSIITVAVLIQVINASVVSSSAVTSFLKEFTELKLNDEYASDYVKFFDIIDIEDKKHV